MIKNMTLSGALEWFNFLRGYGRQNSLLSANLNVCP